jgi:hypothetical protein
MRIIVYLSIFVSLMACQSKTKTSQNKKQTDTVSTAKILNTDQKKEFLAFGFSNESGSKILAFEEGIKPEYFTQTIDNQNIITPIKFEGFQKGTENGVNLVSSNFKNCIGQVFLVTNNKKVQNDLSNVILNDAFLKYHYLISIETLDQPIKIDEANKNKISAERKRKIKEAWKIAYFGNESVFIVVFEPKKDSVLASMVVGNKEFVYRDYPAKYDASSTWRVDDGGEFPKDAIKILALFRNKVGELEIITEWAGAEGANIEYAKANKNRFVTIKEASRYWGAL